MPTRYRYFSPTDPRVKACERAKERAGGFRALAAKLRVTPQAVYLWQIVPVERLEAVEELTGIKARVLRPDIAAIFKRKKPADRAA